ncbi:MAG TPA: PilN domain-containing protein [Acidobacteriota bacterium]|nr:PilN domain-containing protein [Acidobacteriota bacterium]
MIYLKSSVGIEIRKDDLLISSLQSNFSAGVFTHFKRITDYCKRDRQEVRREVDQFFKAHQLDRSNVILGVPRGDVIIRHLDMPTEIADNLKQVVQYQVQSFEPTEEEKYYYDFVQVNANPGAKRLVVLLVMVKKSVLDGHLQVLRELGIKPKSVTSNSVALSNLLLQSRRDLLHKTFILAQLTASGIEIIALRDGTLAYSRETPREDSGNWKELLLREVEEATGKVRMGPEDTIEKFVLAGDGAEEAQQLLRQDVPDCELIGGCLRFEMPPANKTHVQEAAASLGLAYSGLVRRPPIRLDLLPRELRSNQARWAYVPAIILSLVNIGLLVALGVQPIIQDRILARKLDQEIQSLRGRVERVQTIRSGTKALQQQIEYVEGIYRKRDMNLEVLRELTTILPQDTFLTMYRNSDGQIQLAGLSSSAPDLIPKLEQSPLIKDVAIQGTIFKDPQTGKDRFNFNAKLERP